MKFKKSSRHWDLQPPRPLLWSPSTFFKKSWLRDWSKSCTSHVISYLNEFPTKYCRHFLVSRLRITSFLFQMKLMSSGGVTEYSPMYGQMYTFMKVSPVGIQTPTHWKMIGRSMTSKLPVLSPCRIIPSLSTHCAFIPARKNSALCCCSIFNF